MTRSESLEKEIESVKAAEKALRKILKKVFTPSQKAAAFDKIYPLAREYVTTLLDEGRVSHHVTEAFEEKVLLSMFGEDFYEKMRPLSR